MDNNEVRGNGQGYFHFFNRDLSKTERNARDSFWSHNQFAHHVNLWEVMRSLVVALGFFAILVSSSPVFAKRSIFTIMVFGGDEECFYETVDLDKHTGRIDFEFTVLHGGTYDIEVTVEDPEKRHHFNGERRESGTLSITSSSSGPFRICFSNEFSYFSAKTVYFELELEVVEIDSRTVDRREVFESHLFYHSLYYMDTVLDEAMNQQWFLKNMEVQDFRTAEELNQRIQWAAGLMTLGMLAVSLAQVYTLRRFFEDKQTLRQRSGGVNQTTPRRLTVC